MTAVLVTVLVAVLLFNLAVSAFLLWLTCRLCRVARPVPGGYEAISYRRALAVALTFFVMSNVLGVAVLAAGHRFHPENPLAVLGATAVLYLALLFAVLRTFLSTGFFRTLL